MPLFPSSDVSGQVPGFHSDGGYACVPALQDFVGILETRVLRLGQCAAARLQNDIRSKMQVIKPVVDHLHFRFAGAGRGCRKHLTQNNISGCTETGVPLPARHL